MNRRASDNSPRCSNDSVTESSPARASKRGRFPRKDLSLEALRKVDWVRFEQLVADLWREMGYAVYVTPEGGDDGVDLIARKRGPAGKTLAIQAKRNNGQSSNVYKGQVQEYNSIAPQTGADEAVIVTSGEFRGTAPDVAADLGVRLVDGETLLTAVERHASLEFYAKHGSDHGIDENELGEEFKRREDRSFFDTAVTKVENAVGGGMVSPGVWKHRWEDSF